MENNYLITRKFRFAVFLLAALTVACTATAMCYSNLIVNNSQNELRRDISQIRDSGNASDLRPPLYTVKEHHGQIGIWNSDGILSQVLDVSVAYLPPRDKELLSRGFKIYTTSELSSVIEDYTG